MSTTVSAVPGAVATASANTRARKSGGFLGMKPLTAVAPGTRTVLGIAFFVLFFVVWAIVTLGGIVPKTFLASPLQMLASGWDLLVNQGFIKDIGMTVWRVVGGFLIAAAIALPLGVLMGANDYGT